MRTYERVQIYYKETQHCYWLYVLIGMTVLLPMGFIYIVVPTPLALRIGLPLLFAFCVISLFSFTFVVHSEGVDIWIGLAKIFRKRIRKSEIKSWEVRRFSPMRDFGGWGIRRGKDGTWAYFFEGRQGVLIRREKGGKYLLGSRNSLQLLQAIEKSVGRKAESVASG